MNYGNSNFRISGGTARSGTRYVEVDDTGFSLCIRVSDLSSRSGFDQALAAHQIVMTPAQKAHIITEASQMQNFPPKEYAEHGGWAGINHYFRSNGTCISAGDHLSFAQVVFSPQHRGISQRGSLRRWKRIINRLAGQNLLQFLIMCSFAGAILPLTNRALNILFEVVGEGKSSALAIAASTSGPAVDRGDGTYWFTPSGTTNWLEQQMLAHADSTAFINEFQVFGASAASTARAQMIYDFIFRFSEGQTRGRFDSVAPLTYRGVGVMSANQRVGALVAARHAGIINPTTSRLISLPGDAGFGAGTLDFIPEREVSGRAFITSVLSATEAHHGTAMPAFLEGLVRMRSNDDPGLRAQITEHIDDFIVRAAGGAGGMHARVAEAFAVVYVGGRLAKHLGVLPSGWDPQMIALECYRRYVASIQFTEGKSVPELLKAYVERPDVIDLALGLPSLTDADMETVSGFRQHGKAGTELLVPPATVTRLFADWNSRKETAELVPFLKRDGAHLCRKRVVRRGGVKERLLVFSNFD